MSSYSQLSPQLASNIPRDPIWQLRVEQYQAMVAEGILTEDDPVELLEGWLVIKMSKKPSHSFTTQILREIINSLLPAGWYVNDQEPITTGDSEPEPDISIVRGERRMYLDRHPQSAEVGLIIEVADSSLERDQTIKKRIYARAGIPVYWIVNLPDKQVEVYSNPDREQADYQQSQIFNLDSEIPVCLSGANLSPIKAQRLFP